MTEILNTLPHRVYRDVDGVKSPIKSGGTYDGKADADNGQIKADSAEARAWLAASGEGETPDAITTDPLLDATVEAQAFAAALSAARLRDPDGDAEDLIDEAAEIAKQSIAKIATPIGTVATNPETGAVLGGQGAAPGVPSYAEGVTFASAQAENAADELVAANKLDPAALKAGKGNGDDGAFKAGDVRGLAS